MKLNTMPKMHVLAAPKEINQCPCIFSICFKLYVLLMFWAAYFSGASANHRLPSLMPISAANAYLYSGCILWLSHLLR